MAQGGYKQQFNGLSVILGLIFNDDKMLVLELRKKLLDTLTTEMPETQRWQKKQNFSSG